MNGNLFVFRPGGTAKWNIFTDWAVLVSAMSCTDGRKMLEFDDSLAPCEIPAGNWPMKDVMWAGFGPRPGTPRTRVSILSGAEFTNLRMIGGQITIVNEVMTPAPSPVADFHQPDLVQIGLRDDCGNPQLVNKGDRPMFDLGDQSVSFFVQNSLLGMPILPDVPAPSPLIQHRGPSRLTFNLLGQNQTGPNLVFSEPGASVLFGALSGSAQVAVDQHSITSGGGTYDFGPQGRIQRFVVPRPPATATTSQTFPTPNALVRCDGNTAFTQVLPLIAGGFGIAGNLSVPLYSGGQEVVVAEVAGGLHLKVAPSPGDTIDGHVNPVAIGKHGSRTFISDGVSNWITISKV
jgi:hypothetical protein